MLAKPAAVEGADQPKVSDLGARLARRGVQLYITGGIPQRTAYSPSKFAQAGFFEALRTELLGSGVDVTVVFPGVVATDIRLHGYGPDGRPAGRSGLDERNAMPVAQCARQIVEAMRTRRRELVMTTRGKLGLWLKLLAPRLVDRMTLRALKKE